MTAGRGQFANRASPLMQAQGVKKIQRARYQFKALYFSLSRALLICSIYLRRALPFSFFLSFHIAFALKHKGLSCQSAYPNCVGDPVLSPLTGDLISYPALPPEAKLVLVTIISKIWNISWTESVN